jgi:hypothetical protein
MRGTWMSCEAKKRKNGCGGWLDPGDGFLDPFVGEVLVAEAGGMPPV